MILVYCAQITYHSGDLRAAHRAIWAQEIYAPLLTAIAAALKRPLNISTLLTLVATTTKAALYCQHCARIIYARLLCPAMATAVGGKFTTALTVHYQRLKKIFTTGCCRKKILIRGNLYFQLNTAGCPVAAHRHHLHPAQVRVHR